MSNGSPDQDHPVFVPLGLEQWRTLVTRGELAGPLPAYGVTPALLAWGEFGPGDDEDLLFAVQSIAAVGALTLDVAADERRIVIATDATGFAPDPSSSLGQGQLPGLERSRIEAVFADDPDLVVTAARGAARGRAVADAWDDPVVTDFSDEHDLGWYGVAEATHW